MKLAKIIEATRTAIGTNAKVLKYELEKLGWRRRIQWIYQQGEEIDGRESIVVRYIKFMTGLKRTDFKSFEYLKFEIELFLNSVEIVGMPAQRNPVQELVDQIEISASKLRSLVVGQK